MKTVVAILLVLLLPLVWGCANNKIIDGRVYKKCGILNEDKLKDPNIEYDIVIGNVIWSVLLVQTIVAPIYFFCFAIYEPIGKKPLSERGPQCP